MPGFMRLWCTLNDEVVNCTATKLMRAPEILSICKLSTFDTLNTFYDNTI